MKDMEGKKKLGSTVGDSILRITILSSYFTATAATGPVLMKL